MRSMYRTRLTNKYLKQNMLKKRVSLCQGMSNQYQSRLNWILLTNERHVVPCSCTKRSGQSISMLFLATLPACLLTLVLSILAVHPQVAVHPHGVLSLGHYLVISVPAMFRCDVSEKSRRLSP